MSQRGPGPIPNRWLNCPRKSDRIIAERFLAFKTPLSKEFNEQIPVECLFSPSMIFDFCKMLKLRLGLWIDLTNTKRFYDRSVVEANGTKYVKLQCRGHGETPSPEQTQAFIELVDNFVEEQPMDVIAVHCTHGFNRTGFLIASYLVERLDYSIEAALSVFSEARPPGIYKQDYINELFRRYESIEDATLAPELPEWCHEFDDIDRSYNARKRKYNDEETSSTSQNAGDFADDDDDEDRVVNDRVVEPTSSNPMSQNNESSPKKRRRHEHFIKNATFMAGVPGIVLVTDQPRLGQLQQKVQNMCGWEKNGFPGCQPVSMDRKNLKRLHEIPYRVSWKADGTRYMMLINQRDEIYFFDRNNSCFQVENLSFVKYGNVEEHLTDTLLDGEMVLDKVNGHTIPRYLIYDIITISNLKIGKEPFFPDRLRCIKKEIIEPRIHAFNKRIIFRDQEPFGVRLKDFWEIRQASSLLGEKFAKALSHEPDGLIFQPSRQPYKAGACPDVLKWKPSELNSVDFRLEIAKESGPGIVEKNIGLLYVGGYDRPFCSMTCSKAIKDLNNKIIECTVNARGKWEFLRERTDKTLPNSYNTANSVIESIRNPVTKEILLDFIAQYGFRDDRDMMPPPTIAHTQQRTEQPPMSNHRNRHQQQQQY